MNGGGKFLQRFPKKTLPSLRQATWRFQRNFRSFPPEFRASYCFADEGKEKTLARFFFGVRGVWVNLTPTFFVSPRPRALKKEALGATGGFRVFFRVVLLPWAEEAGGGGEEGEEPSV